MEESEGGGGDMLEFLLYHYPVEADIDFLDLSLRLNLEPCDRRNVAGQIILIFLPEESPFLESPNLDLNTGIANEEIQVGDMPGFLLDGDEHIFDDHYPSVVANDSLDLSLRLSLEPCDRPNVAAGEINLLLPEERSWEASPESLNLDLNMGILNQGSGGGGGGDMLGFLLGEEDHYPVVAAANDSLDLSLSLNLEPCDRRNLAAGQINFLLPEESSEEAGPVIESPNLDSTTTTLLRLQLSGSRHYSTVENGLLPNLQNNNENVGEESCGVRVSSYDDERLMAAATAKAALDDNINVKKRSRAMADHQAEKGFAAPSDIPEDPTRHDEPRTKNIKLSPAIQEN
ncbi:hypothetical protein KSP40_PGU007688 [Platanthera guangdongensis]|uniref:Uncharacterized protein n=1 Tax=Platanthera guangdongensis TaxID=2320717 RepID=A0ABR2LK19_9ASPA